MAKKHLLTSIVSVFLLSGILQVLIAQESRFPQMTLPEKLLASLKSGHPRLHATKADFRRC